MNLLRIAHGSRSPSKMSAVEKAMQEQFPFPFALEHIEIASIVATQPRCLAETVRGAKARAFDALLKGNAHFGIGIESGIVELPGSRSGAMELCVCSIFNGKNHALGQSAGMEVPVPVMSDIITNTHTLTEGFESIGLISGEHEHGGNNILSMLTHGRMTRRMQNEQALTMALIQLDFPGLYGYRD